MADAAAVGAGKLGYSGRMSVARGDSFLLLASGARTPVGLGNLELRSGPDDCRGWSARSEECVAGSQVALLDLRRWGHGWRLLLGWA